MSAQDLTPLYIQLGTSLLVAIVTALFTVWLALNRFYREKWWEARMKAYTDIIQALHHMKRDLEISLPAAYEQRETDSDFHKGWAAKHSAAWDEVRKHIDLGEFLISKRAVRLLSDLSDECYASPNELYVDYLESSEAAVRKCLPLFKRAARNDLRLRH